MSTIFQDSPHSRIILLPCVHGPVRDRVFRAFARNLARENNPGATPCRSGGLAYQQTNTLINQIVRKMPDAAALQFGGTPPSKVPLKF